MNSAKGGMAGATRTVTIPGSGLHLDLSLPSAIVRLRDAARAAQRRPQPGLPDRELIDAAAWQAHDDDEPWLIWRARRCAERLRQMPIDVPPDERLVGRPLFRDPTPEEEQDLLRARQVLSSMPPFPGGDAGHFHPDFEGLFQGGIQGLRDRIRTLREEAGNGDAGTFYTACEITLDGLSTYIRRAAQMCDAMASENRDEAERWHDLACICRHISAHPPRTFPEALQLMFLTQMALWFGEDHALTCPGRIDQTLWRFYERDVNEGRLSPRDAFELICCLYIQMNRVLWPGSAVAVMVGGRDPSGRPVTNELTYLALAAREATRLVYPTVGLAWNQDLPGELVDYAVEMLATGIGDPAFFNDDLIAQGLGDHGVRQADRHNYMNSTCVEIKVCGASNMWVTQPYINCPQALLDVLERAAQAVDDAPEDFDALCQKVKETLALKIRVEAERLDGVWSRRTRHGGFPLASCVIADCLERGKDFDRGGARYNWVENSFVGLANLVDSLVAVRHLVFEESQGDLAGFHGILASDFEGSEPLRQRIANTLPKYGNADPEADELAAEIAHFLVETTLSHRVGLHAYVPGFFCWVMHERMGSATGATPDGRRAGRPLADGAGAAQGREKHGPSASILSTTAWSHRQVLGGLVHNVKFSKRTLASAQGKAAVRALVETYLRRGGFEIQVNVVGTDTLRAAQRDPEAYEDLLVRVAGYSDYFVHLNEKQQDEVIARTEHSL